jgi:hypothetical protein
MSWTKVSDNTFSAFASDIDSYKKTTGKGPRCPRCRKELKMSFIYANRVRRGEEPAAEFINTHECGAHIHVFND